ncbi:MAG: alpha/beta hydrolase [Ruminococcaceae bacterium]|nr:alpha/beta hydrolase [Oscillospiraceae bacterium]
MEANGLFHGFKMEEFDFEDTKGIVVFPDVTANNKIVFKTEYWGAFPDLEIEFLKRGFHLVHIQNKTRLANKNDCERKARFIELVSQKYSLDKKCILVGMSCGGAQAVNFAGYYPQYVACMMIDAPVLNFLDFPGRFGEYEPIWESEFKEAYPNVKRSDIFTLEENPINRAPKLIEERIPIVMLYGTEDKTVDYLSNGRLLEEAYSENMELLTVIPRNFQGHHPHGLMGREEYLADIVISKLQ